MSISLRDTAITALPTFATSSATTLPTNVSGDLMLAHHRKDAATTLTPPAGWSLATSTALCHIYAKYSNGSEPSSYTWTSGALMYHRAVVTSWYHGNGKPLLANVTATQTNTGGTYQWASVTPTVQTEALLLAFGDIVTDVNLTPDAAMTELYDSEHSTDSLYLMSEPWTADPAVATGTRAATFQAGVPSTDMHALSVLLVPDFGGVFRIFYDGTEISQCCNTGTLESQIAMIEANDFTSTAGEMIAALARWSLALGGFWKPWLDDILGQDVVDGCVTRPVEVTFRQHGGLTQVSYSWTVGNMYIYKVASAAAGAVEFTGELILSGAPTRTVK